MRLLPTEQACTVETVEVRVHFTCTDLRLGRQQISTENNKPERT
jgi:hypothetical protein